MEVVIVHQEVRSIHPLCLQENGCRQKSKVCEAFDRLFALLEDRKCEMMVQINAEQEEKLDYIRGLRRRHSEHLESSAKLLESAIQTLDQSEMALFLQVRPSTSEDLLGAASILHRLTCTDRWCCSRRRSPNLCFRRECP